MTRSTWPAPPPPRGDVERLADPPGGRRAVAEAVKRTFAWRSDPWDRASYADTSGWLADPLLLRGLGPALADLACTGPQGRPDVVLGLQSQGFVLGALAAAALGVGFVPVLQGAEQCSDDDAWRRASTPPDYRRRTLELAFRRALVRPGAKVVLVDDWVATGGQALGVQRLVADADAHWCGLVTVVDGLTERQVRRELDVRSIVRLRELS